MGRYQGLADTRISSIGTKSSVVNSGLIKELIANGMLDENSLSISTSPLQRAQESAAIIGDTLGHTSPPDVNSSFRELSVGRWEGLNSQQVKDMFYEERQGRKLNRWNFRPQGGESMAERCGTIENALVKLPSNSIVVTHCGVLRVVLHILGGRSKEDAATAEIPHIGLMYWDGAILHRQVD